MAVLQSLRSELNGVSDACAEAQSLIHAMESITPESTVPMVYAFRCQFERLESAFDALEKTLRQRVIPLVEDFERVSQ